MNLDDFSTEINNRRYVKPDKSLGEQNAFINKIRDIQKKQNTDIKTSTQNLGTHPISSSMGGLSGGESYFNARYQTPQTNEVIANLKTAAQAQALNEAMQQELGVAKKKLYDAQRAYNKRKRKEGNTPPNTPNVNPEDYEGNVIFQAPEDNSDAYSTESEFLFDYVDPIEDFKHKMGREPNEEERRAIEANIKASENEARPTANDVFFSGNGVMPFQKLGNGKNNKVFL